MSEGPRPEAEDFEIRFLPDGRVVFVGPDQALVDLAQTLSPEPEERTRHE